MKNVWKIIELFGGLNALKANYIKIPGTTAMMPLVIEHIGTGPRGMECVSVCHTYLQSGDVMRDPEMTFELGLNHATDPDHWYPVMYQQDNLGLYQVAVYANDQGQVFMNSKLARSLKSFARMWDKNIGEQGYIETAKAQAAEARHDPYLDETPLGIALDDNPLDD